MKHDCGDSFPPFNLNQMEFYLIHNHTKNCHHDHVTGGFDIMNNWYDKTVLCNRIQALSITRSGSGGDKTFNVVTFIIVRDRKYHVSERCFNSICIRKYIAVE